MSAKEGTAVVTDLANDGSGIARVDGKVTFIAGALPGETVRYRVDRRGRQADEATALGIEQPSADRVAPRCPHFGVCGGCSLQHLSGAAQVAFKQKHLLDALQRIGKVEAEEIAAPVTGPEWGYRRRARLNVYRDTDGVRIGFHERGTPFTARLASCAVLDSRVGGRIEALATLLAAVSPGVRIAQIEVAAAETVALVVRVLDGLSEADHELLRAFGAKEGFDFYLQPGGLDTVKPLDPSAPPLTYSPDGALRLGFAPTDFIQVNDAVNRRMARQALAWLEAQPGEQVLELFSGLGNFTLPLARTGAAVTAVEGDAGLVRKARDNAGANGLTLRVELANLFEPDPRANWLKQRYDKVLLDPPRAGAREVLEHAGAWQASRILYVSCHPGTLARDAATLVQRHGYRLRRAGILDMFPHTAHVESMALFVRD